MATSIPAATPTTPTGQPNFSKLTKILDPRALSSFTEQEIVRQDPTTGQLITDPSKFRGSSIFLREGIGIPTGLDPTYFVAPSTAAPTNNINAPINTTGGNLPANLYNSFNLQVPGTIPSTLVQEGFDQNKTYGDIQKLLGEQSKIREQVLSKMQPTQLETDLGKQLVDLRARADELQINRQAGIEAVRNKVMPLEFMTGQEKNINDTANTQLQSYAMQEKNLLSRLGLEQEGRKAGIEALTAAGQFITEDLNTQFKIQDILDKQEERVLQQANLLRDDSRETLTTLLDMFKGLDLEELDLGSQQQLATVAAQSGIPLNLLVTGMKAVKDEMDFKNLLEAQKLNKSSQPTSVQEYEFARGQGYEGSFLDFLATKEDTVTGLSLKDRLTLAFQLIDRGEASSIDEALAKINSDSSGFDTDGFGEPGQPRGVRNNNPGNIKVPAGGLEEAIRRYGDPNVTVDPSPAADGGYFLKFSDPTIGFNAIGKLLDVGYKNLTVDAAMKRWSNNGYDSEIVPNIPKGKTIGQLSSKERTDLTNAMIRREGSVPTNISIKTGGAISEQQAKALRAGVTALTVGLTDKDQTFTRAEINRQVNGGNLRGAKEFLIATALGSMPAAEQTQVVGRFQAIDALNTVKRELDAFTQAGGNINQLTGNLEKLGQKFGVSTNPQLSSIATKIQAALIEYRRAISGAAFTDAEMAQYKQLFPDIDKLQELNDYKITALNEVFNANQRTSFGLRIGGDNYNTLFGSTPAFSYESTGSFSDLSNLDFLSQIPQGNQGNQTSTPPSSAPLAPSLPSIPRTPQPSTNPLSPPSLPSTSQNSGFFQQLLGNFGINYRTQQPPTNNNYNLNLRR